MTKIDLIKELMNPSVYDEKVDYVKLLQTHISWVFLTGNFAYKIKKPVDFEFLDFTTLEKRKFFCEEEIRVNRRLCPGLYLKVVPITRSEEGIRIDGKGKVIEYAVKMKELPRERMMDKLLERNEIDEENIDEIARILAEFHEKAATGKGIDNYGSISVIKKNWNQNFNQTISLRENLIKKEIFDEIENGVNDFIKEHSKLFKKRIKDQRIRECHGDVHSGNIFVVDGKVYIFDAIEFNKAFSCSDVAAEIAFLAMDLDFHNRRDLSKFFVERYVEYSKDEEILKLLNFYKCYRAYVRAKVISFRLNEEGKTAEKLCKRYFDLALEYARNF